MNGSEELVNTSFGMRLKIRWRTEEIQQGVQLLFQVTGITQEGFACMMSEENSE